MFSSTLSHRYLHPPRRRDKSNFPYFLVLVLDTGRKRWKEKKFSTSYNMMHVPPPRPPFPVVIGAPPLPHTHFTPQPVTVRPFSDNLASWHPSCDFVPHDAFFSFLLPHIFALSLSFFSLALSPPPCCPPCSLCWYPSDTRIPHRQTHIYPCKTCALSLVRIQEIRINNISIMLKGMSILPCNV